MADLPNLRNINVEDFKDAPEWFRQYIERLNPFLASVTDTLAGGITSQNLNRQDEPPFLLDTLSTLAATFAPGRVQFKNRLGRKPVEVRLAQCEPQSGGDSPTPGQAQWELLQNGMIQINMIPGLTVNKKYRLTFRVD